MELPKEPRLYQLKKGFAKRKGIPIYFTAIPITQTEKAVYLYGHGTLETLAMGVCWMCGCTLTHPVSKALGVGPICGGHAYNWNLVGGYTEENIKRLKEVILQKAVVDTWVPKSVVIEVQPTKETVELPDTHPMAGNKKTGKTTTTKEEPENDKIAKLLRTKENKLFIKIEFPFDRDLIDHIKTLPGRVYKNDGYNNKYWLCPFAVPTVDQLKGWGFFISKGLQDWYDEQSKPQDLSIPGLGGTLYPFQREGVETLERLGGRAIIGLDMGLGKTVIAIAFMQLHQEARPVIVICPANAKMVWVRHAKTWLTNPTVHLIDGYPNGNELTKPSGNDVYIVNYDVLANRSQVPDKEKVKEVWNRVNASLDSRQVKVFKNIQKNWDKLQKSKSSKWDLMGVVYYQWEEWCKDPEFVRLQGEWFGVLEKEEKKGWLEPLLELNAPLLIIDECHRIKHKTAARTKATLELIEKGKYVVPMSGTPIERHPDEFYTVLSALRPDLFGNWKWYMSTFCDLKHDGYGWDTSGAINTEQLNKLVMGTVMIRRLKKDVLPDLPKKQRALVPLEVDLTKYNKVASDVIGYIQKTKGKEAAERAKQAESLVTIETLLQACMEAKLKPCIEWLENFLESDEKVVVFAHHRTVVDAIFNHFKKEAVQIVGGMSPTKRTEAEDQFQNNPTVKMLVGSITAANEAITLTAASNTVTLEITRKPSTHFQAEDRVLRIGQEADSCTAYYLVAAGTIEEEVLEVLNYRERILAQVQDGRAVDDDTNDMFDDLLTKLQDKRR